MLQPSVVQAATFLVTLGSSLALVMTTRWHGPVSLDTTTGPQKFHSAPTARIGGLATLAGLVAGYGVAPEPVRQLLGLLLVASMPALFAGLLEDMTKKVGVRERLLATIFSGFLGWYLTGVALTRTGVPGLDALLSIAPVSVIFTAVAIGGVANAVNIIDGFNGLASGVLSIMFMALGLIAASVGDHVLAATCWALVACCVGFTLVNWPLGKIFLGDGGAYQLGFALGWIAVLLVARNPSVPAWSPLLVCAYPVLEVAFSIVRKTRRAGYNPGQPDRVHLHMLVFRRVVRPRLPSFPPALQNGMTSPFAWLYTAALAAWGTIFAQQTPYLVAGFVVAAVAYASVYTRLTRFRWWPSSARAPKSRGERSGAPPASPSKALSYGLAPWTPLAAQPFYMRDNLNFSAGSAPALVPMNVPAVLDLGEVQVRRYALLAYGILGLSTCVTVVEPAPFELIALPLVLASSIRNVLAQSRPYTPSSGSLVVLLALFSLLQVVSLLGGTQNLLHAARYAAITALLIIIGTYLGQLFGRGDMRFRIFARFYCVAALLSATIAIGSLYLAGAQVAPDWLLFEGRPKAFFKDPNVLGPYLVPAVLVFLYQAGRVRASGKIFYMGCALLCALGVIATASRGAWVNLTVAVVVFALLARGKATVVFLLAALASLVLALGAATGSLSVSAPELFELFAGRMQLQDYDADRFLAAQAAVELGLRHPLGVGPGDITSHMGLAAMDPHNTYVRIWAENGPAALLLFLVIIAAASASTLQAWFNTRGKTRDALAVVLALLVGVLVNAAVVDVLHWRHFWVIVGLCVFSSHAYAWGRR